MNFWHADSPRYAAACRSVAEAELSNGRLAPKFKGYLEGIVRALGLKVILVES